MASRRRVRAADGVQKGEAAINPRRAPWSTDGAGGGLAHHRLRSRPPQLPQPPRLPNRLRSTHAHISSNPQSTPRPWRDSIVTTDKVIVTPQLDFGNVSIPSSSPRFTCNALAPPIHHHLRCQSSRASWPAAGTIISAMPGRVAEYSLYLVTRAIQHKHGRH